MSRIGKKPVAIPSGVNVEVSGGTFKVSGPKGKLQYDINSAVMVKVEGNQILVENPNPDDRVSKAMHGTTRALVNNMIIGVSEGFERKLEIYGTGYNIKEQGGKLILQIGFCHPVEFKLPADVKLKIDVPATKGNEVPAKFSLSGPDKHILGQFAANVRKVRPPEPYQGKGIRYADEFVRRKAGKSLASGG